MGQVHVLDARSWLAGARATPRTASLEEELARVHAAQERAHQQLSQVRKRILARGRRDDAEIFAAHQQLIEDPALVAAIEQRIRAEDLSAEAAVAHTAEAIHDKFRSHPSPLVGDKADDVLDVGHRLIRCLSPSLEALATTGAPMVLVAASLEPSELVRFAHRGPCAAVVETCGPRSHVAILARSLGIPLVSGIAIEALREHAGREVCIDGDHGRVELEPTSAWVSMPATTTSAPRTQPLRSSDGVPISVALNLSDPTEADAVAELGADGVGLFRSEFLYLDRDTWPTERECLEIFQRVSDRVAARPLAIRLADFGADKCPEYADFRAGRNPSLGLRGVRLLLAYPEVLGPQVRALRALAQSRPLTVLIPMLDGVDTLDRLEVEIRRLCQLGDAPLPFALGAMVEVPAAALGIRDLVPRVAAAPIGLNDLTQYVLAADREDEWMERYHDPLHPTLLRLIRDVVECADAAHCPVSICGELAGNPALTAVLLTLGLRRFSVSRGDYDRIVRLLESLSVLELDTTRDELLSQSSSGAVRRFIEKSDAYCSSP